MSQKPSNDLEVLARWIARRFGVSSSASDFGRNSASSNLAREKVNPVAKPSRFLKRILSVIGFFWVMAVIDGWRWLRRLFRFTFNDGQFFEGVNMSSWTLGSILPLLLLGVVVILVIKGIRVVPQQHAHLVERLGKFDKILNPGLNIIIPVVDKVAYKHDLREIPLDVPSQVCITKDNTQLQVDGILYYQVTDPKLASYGSTNFELAITQLAQTTLRSVIGRLELDKTFEERDMINHAVVSALDEAARNWGVKVLRYEIKDLTPPKEILHAMQAQITAEREKRALIAASEGRRQEQINIATGQREASIAKSEGDKQAAINNAQGEAAAILAKAEASAEAIRKIAAAIEAQGGMQAVNLKVAEQYVAAFGNIAKQGNTLIVPSNLTDVAAIVQTATTMIKAGDKK